MTNSGEEPIDIRSAIAAEAGVSRGTVQNYMEIAKHGPPELLEQVQSGALKIGKAHSMLHKEVMKRMKYADGLLNYLDRHLPIEDDEEANKKIMAQLWELHLMLSQLRRKIKDVS